MAINYNYSTITAVLSEYLNQLTLQWPGLKSVYDSEKSYKSSIEKYRARNNNLGATSPALPLFSFYDNLVLPSEFMRRQSSRKLMIDRSSSKFVKGVYGEVKVDFTLYTTNDSDYENFSLGFLGEDLMTNIKVLTVPILLNATPDDFSYTCRYEDLQTGSTNIDGVFYKSITGSFSLHGWWVYVSGPSVEISTVIANINSIINNKIFNTITVP